MPTLLDTFLPYIPTLTLRRIALDPAPITAPRQERLSGAVLFADISGFTALSERLSERGPEGAETLSADLNDYFGQLTALITEYGGDVVKFAGDALLALWPSTGDDLRAAVQAAATCALVAQKELHNYAISGTEQLAMRIAVGAGEITTMHIGGVFGRWEFMIAGEPINQVGQAQGLAHSGQVVLTHSAWQLLGSESVGQVLPVQPLVFVLESLRTPLFPTPLRPPTLDPQVETALRAYIPGAVIARLTAASQETVPATIGAWLGELRRITVLFVNLPTITYDIALEQAHTVMQTLQKALYHYEGSLNKLSVDDKGVTLVAVLGLPPLAHEDDAVRGVLAGLRMKAELAKLDVPSAIGVATGQVFCGAVGGASRREYTVIGDVVNLAARLMQAAPGTILCDGNAYQSAQGRIAFEALPAISIKGKAELIPIFQPTHEKKTALRAQTEIVGRVSERDALAAGIQSLLRGGSDFNVYLIEGDAGIGKSRLVDEVRRHAQALGVQTLAGTGDAVERRTLYFAWRTVFNQLLDVEFFDNVERLRRHVRLALGPQLMRLAPLLRDALGLDIPDNETTAALSGQGRADQTRALLVQLLQDSVMRTPKVLIIEDAHWLDSASWALALEVSRKVRPLMLVIATRPLQEPYAHEYVELMRAGNIRRLKLDTLPTEDALALVRQRLQVTSLPEAMMVLIRDRAEGNPFFSEELAYALRDAGLIEIVNGECRLAATADLQTVKFPETVEGVITSRIDRLAPAQQMTLKAASVIGRVFAFSTLFNIYPIAAERPLLSDYIQMLERLDLTPLETPEPDLAYIFKHIITQEVAYNLMLFAQRRELHKAVAEWHEQHYANDLSPYYPVLAHHYSRAELWSKALHYHMQAGDAANRLYAFPEARIHYDAALEALTRLPNSATHYRYQAEILAKRVAVAWVSDDIERNFARLRQAEAALAALKESVTEEDPQDRRTQGYVLYWLGRLHYLRNEPREAIGYYKQVIAIGKEFNDPELVAIPSSFIGQVLMVQGHVMQARALLFQAVEPLTQTGNWVEWVRTIGFCGITLVMGGERQAGFRETDRGLQRAHELRNQTSIASSHVYRASACVATHESARLLEESEAVVNVSTQSGDRMLQYMGHAFRAWAKARLGDVAGALADREKSVTIGQTVGGRLLLADWFNAMDAEIALLGGRVAEAQAKAEQAAQSAQAVGGILSQAIAERVWGQACAQQQEWTSAETHLAKGLWLFETAGNYVEAAHTRHVWAQVCARQGRVTDAREHWAKALAQFETSELTEYAEAVRAARAELPA